MEDRNGEGRHYKQERLSLYVLLLGAVDEFWQRLTTLCGIVVVIEIDKRPAGDGGQCV